MIRFVQFLENGNKGIKTVIKRRLFRKKLKKIKKRNLNHFQIVKISKLKIEKRPPTWQSQ